MTNAQDDSIAPASTNKQLLVIGEHDQEVVPLEEAQPGVMASKVS